METYKIKEMIMELENEVTYFQECLAVYKGCTPLPPVAKDWERMIVEREEKIKELHELLFDSIQKPKPVGRPSLGTTKKVSLTLQDDVWEKIEKLKEERGVKKQSQLLRSIIEDYFKEK